MGNMEMNSKIKDALVKIDFVKRYEELSAKYNPAKTPSDDRLELIDGEEVMSMISALGYTPKFNSKEKFFYIQDEVIGDFSFRVHLILQYGMADIVWVVKEKDELLLGSPWGTYAKRIVDAGCRIKKPVFASYDELEDILKVSFKMYEEFKAAVAC